MKQLLIIVALAVAVVFAYKAWDKNHTLDVSRKRVEVMVRSMAEKDEQTALCIWALDKRILDSSTMASYQLPFMRFWSESGLGGGTGWTVADVKLRDDGHTTLVTVSSGDRKVVLDVWPNQPIALVKSE